MRARGLGLVLGVFCVAVGMLVFSGAVAVASQRYVPVSQFGGEGSGEGQFSSPAGVAVDQSNGAVYVVDQGNNRVGKFDSNGAFVSQFNGEGTPAGSFSGENGIAVDNSTNPLDPSAGDVYVVDTGNNVVDKFSSAGTYLGQISATPGGPFAGTPLDGVAVDPAGNVWVYQALGEVDEYDDSAGNAFLTSWSMELGASAGLAVDASDQVYAVTGCGCVERFQGDGTDLGQLDGGFASSIAVDQASGDVFVNDGQHIAQYNAGGEALGQFGSEVLGAGSGVAVNQSSTDVYVADAASNRVVVLRSLLLPDATTEGASGVTTSGASVAGSVNPEGVALTSCQFEYGTSASYGQSVACSPEPGASGEPVPVTASLTGLEANTTYHYRVIASNASGTTTGEDHEFLTPSPPILERDPYLRIRVYSESVTVTGATLTAGVNPVGADTTYHFEYGPTTSYGTSVPVPAGDIGAGTSSVPVMQHLTGLQPATSYHYRVVASNTNGTTNGPDKVFTTFAVPAGPSADTCPNAALRTGPSGNLPDCRAYEMVSPLDKNGSDVQLVGLSTAASAGGDRALFAAHAGFAGAMGSGTLGYTQYVASRGVDGWSTRGETPTPAVNANQLFVGGTLIWAVGDELDHVLLEATDLPGVSGGVPGGINVYREDTATGQLQAITTPLGPEPVGPLALVQQSFRGLSSDLGVVSFETTANMVAQATGSNSKLYAWDHGTLRLAGILPDGTVPAGGSAAPENGFKFHTEENQSLGGFRNYDTVSGDGSRVLFVSLVDESAARQLYMRRNASDTVWVSRSEASSANPEPQGIAFQTASLDGRRVLFTSTDRLLDSDPGGAEAGLYLYTDSPDPEAESNLTFIARVNATSASDGDAYGMSEDAKHIYFFSAPAPGLPIEGVYLWDRGSVHTVAESNVLPGAARVSADGRRIAFLRQMQPPSQDIGIDPAFNTPWNAMYMYDEASEKLTCVSCPPSGAATTSPAQIAPAPGGSGGSSVEVPFRPRFFSRDGRYVFFSTGDALVPQDTNGLYDVYEYDADTGRVSLLSSGTGDEGTWFAGASANGSDVFLLTRQSLVGRDTDTLIDLYDARVNGGLAEQPRRGVCDGDACQGAPGAAPVLTQPSRYSGPGNALARPAAKAKAKSKPREHAKKKARKHRRKKAKRAGKRTFRRAAHR